MHTPSNRIRPTAPRLTALTATILTAALLPACGLAARSAEPAVPAAAASNDLISAQAVEAPMIVIDPGHSGKRISSVDKSTGLRDIDYPNFPEIYEMWDVSACLGEALKTDGYRVTLTKSKARSSVGLAERARLASRVDAALAISVHDDHGATSSFQATYSQRGFKHHGKYHAMYRGRGSHRTVFKHPAVAKASQKYAETLAAERGRILHRKVSVRENIYTGRAPLEPGNLGLVQLLTDVPWVYNEMGAKTNRKTSTALSINSELRYAQGLLRGVEASVPLTKGKKNPASTGVKTLRSCLVKKVEPVKGQYTRPKRYLPYGF